MNYPSSIRKINQNSNHSEELIISSLLKSYLQNLSSLLEFNSLNLEDFLSDDLDKELSLIRENDYTHLSDDDFINDKEDDLRERMINDLSKEIDLFNSLL